MYAPMRGLESPCQLTVAVAASVSAYNWRVPAWFARMPIMSPVSGRSRSTTERIFASGGSKMWTCVDHIRSGVREAEVRRPRRGGEAHLGLGAHRFFEPARVFPPDDIDADVVRDPDGAAHSCCSADFEAEHGDFAAFD